MCGKGVGMRGNVWERAVGKRGEEEPRQGVGLFNAAARVHDQTVCCSHCSPAHMEGVWTVDSIT
eukprot:339801-Rhodomonas_salina.1